MSVPVDHVRLEQELTEWQIFLSAGDQTIIVSSYGKIGSELKALNNTSWIATAWVPQLQLAAAYPLNRSAQLLPDSHILPATIWKMQRYLRAKASASVRICNLWHWLPLLWSCEEHERAHCCKSKPKRRCTISGIDRI